MKVEGTVMVRTGLILLVSLLFVFAANHKITPFFSNFISNQKIEILAEKLIDLDQDGRVEKVTKVKIDGKIYVKIYQLFGLKDTVETREVASYTFLSSEDGFIYNRKLITNLAFADVNRDGQIDLLVSYFNKQTKQSAVQTLTWNKENKNLEVLKEEI